jgi:hypothetical protein
VLLEKERKYKEGSNLFDEIMEKDNERKRKEMYSKLNELNEMFKSEK